MSSANMAMNVYAITQYNIPYRIALEWITTAVPAPMLSWSLFLHEHVCAF